MAAALAAISPVGAAEPVTMVEEVSVQIDAAGEALSASPLLDCGSPGACWEVATVSSVTVNLNLAGHHKRCTKRCRIPVTFGYAIDGESYEVDGGFLFGCPAGLASIGSGTVRPRRQRLNLVPDFPDEVERVLGICFNGSRPRFSSWVRFASDRASLRGKTSVRGRWTQVTTIGDGTTRAAFKAKHDGVPLGSPVPPKIKQGLPICPPVLSVRCELVVQQP